MINGHGTAIHSSYLQASLLHNSMEMERLKRGRDPTGQFTNLGGSVACRQVTVGKNQLEKEKQKFMLQYLPKQVACCHRG